MEQEMTLSQLAVYVITIAALFLLGAHIEYIFGY
jgi:hypothetical protein